eukprot:scaffold18040_cov107-Isochrysis_galbana.AAC.5
MGMSGLADQNEMLGRPALQNRLEHTPAPKNRMARSALLGHRHTHTHPIPHPPRSSSSSTSAPGLWWSGAPRRRLTAHSAAPPTRPRAWGRRCRMRGSRRPRRFSRRGRRQSEAGPDIGQRGGGVGVGGARSEVDDTCSLARGRGGS